MIESQPVEAPRLFQFSAPRTEWLPWAALTLITIAFGVTFCWLSVARHQAFQSHAFDLGNMDQAVWNTLHGHPLRFTDMAMGNTVLTNRLDIHVEPLLLALAPLYLLHSGPETLLVLQSLVVASGAVPAYLLARAAGVSAWGSLSFPLAYLFHPSLQNAVLDDFHAVTLSACFLLWALYFAYQRQLLLFALTAIVAAATKEEIGLLVAMLGLLLIARGRAAAGIRAILAGTGWFIVCMAVIIPFANPSGHSPYLSRYAYLGHGLVAVALSPLHHPDLVWHTLTSAQRLDYLDYVLEPVGFAALAGLPIFLLSLPVLLLNMLSADPTMYSGFYQYSAEIVPFVIGAGALGTGWVARRSQPIRWRRAWVEAALCLIVVVAASLDTYHFGFTPLARGYLVPDPGAHQILEGRLLGKIPATAVVAAADEIEPHLSDRRWIYLLPTVNPTNGPAARYLAIDATVPSLPVRPRTLHTLAARALKQGWGILAADDGVLILRRGGRLRRLPSSFYRFIYEHSGVALGSVARWGPLTLQAIVVHPRDGLVNRSRPSIGVETFWQTSGALPAGARISVVQSPVYRGDHPAWSSHWLEEDDSPTTDWLPLVRWPVHRTISAAFVPVSPPPYRSGSVDIGLRVQGPGSASAPSAGRVRGSGGQVIRVGTIEVDG